VVTDDERVIGFAVVAERFADAAELVWAAVASDRRGQGAGTTLVNQILDELMTYGVGLVEVKTLDGSVDYAPYEATRAFWERRGFRQIDTLDPLPGWQPGNPAAIYVAALKRTR
jgi:GNAT superfamily N-acetyltransferase